MQLSQELAAIGAARSSQLVEARCDLATSYEKLGEEKEAQAAFQKVLKMFPEQEEVVKIARKHLQEISQRSSISSGHAYFPLAFGNRWIYDHYVGETLKGESLMQLILASLLIKKEKTFLIKRITLP